MNLYLDINISMKYLVVFILFIFSCSCSDYKMSEEELSSFAKSINSQLQGTTIPKTGIKISQVLYRNKFLEYYYDVPTNWIAPNDIKEQLLQQWNQLSKLKKMLVDNKVNVVFYYYENSILSKRVIVYYNEFN